MTGEQTDKQPANLQTKLVDSLESDLQILESENQIFYRRNMDEEEKICLLKKLIEEKQEEQVQQQKLLLSSQEELSKLEKLNINLKQESEALQLELDTTDQDLATAQKNNKDLEIELSSKKPLLERLKEKLLEQEQKTDDTEEKLTDLSLQIENFTVKIANIVGSSQKKKELEKKKQGKIGSIVESLGLNVEKLLSTAEEISMSLANFEIRDNAQDASRVFQECNNDEVIESFQQTIVEIERILQQSLTKINRNSIKGTLENENSIEHVDQGEISKKQDASKPGSEHNHISTRLSLILESLNKLSSRLEISQAEESTAQHGLTSHHSQIFDPELTSLEEGIKKFEIGFANLLETLTQKTSKAPELKIIGHAGVAQDIRLKELG